MKKVITTLTLLLSISAAVVAQSTKKFDEETNCYIKWAQKFENRGAEEVADGIYTDVIITFRTGGEAECFNGKCEVKEGKVKGMYIKMEDGSYEQVKKRPKYENVPLLITNGMSKPLLTAEDELINVLFIKKIKPKKAGFEKAAEPSDD
jgi:hypothetical protein